jgi:hypothetical protein
MDAARRRGSSSAGGRYPQRTARTRTARRPPPSRSQYDEADDERKEEDDATATATAVTEVATATATPYDDDATSGDAGHVWEDDADVIATPLPIHTQSLASVITHDPLLHLFQPKVLTWGRADFGAPHKQLVTLVLQQQQKRV